MSPRGGANKIVGSALVPHQRSARVTGANGGAILVCALNRVVDGLSWPGCTATGNGNVFQVGISQVSGCSSVGSDSAGIILVISVSRAHERSAVVWTSGRRVDDGDWRRVRVNFDGLGEFDHAVIVDDEISVVAWVGDKVLGRNALSLGIVNITDVGSERRLFAMSSAVQESGGDDRSTTKVTGGLEGRLPRNLTVLGQLAADAVRHIRVVRCCNLVHSGCRHGEN